MFWVMYKERDDDDEEPWHVDSYHGFQSAALYRAQELKRQNRTWVVVAVAEFWNSDEGSY